MMIDVKRPVLLDASLAPVRTMNAESLNLSFNSPGVSQATMVLPPGELEPPMHAWVNLYNQNGFCGVFRVTTPQTDFFESQSVTLRHGIDVLADAVCAEQSEFSGTVRQLLIKILSYQTQKIGNTKFWTLGTCEDTNTIKRSINYDNLLDLIAKIEEEEPDFYFVYDQSSFPWTLHFLAKPANADTEFRVNRGIRTISRTRNDNELCTQLILSVNTQVTSGSGDFASTETVSAIKTYNNTAAQAVWGIIQKTADIDTGDNLEGHTWPEANAWAAKFLAQRSAPADQIQISGDEFKRVTGDAWDEMKLGHICRVPIPDKGVTLSDRVVNVTYPDALGDPTNVTLSLANQLPKFSSGIATLKKESASTAASARASARGGVGAAKAKELKAWSMIVRDQQLALDGTGIMELYESGISMDAQGGVKIYSLAQGFQSNYAEIQVNNQAITTEVRRATESEGVIATYASQTASQIKLELYAADSRLGSYIAATATSLTAAVYNAESSMATYINQTASTISLELYAADSRLGSYVAATATSISQAVYNAESGLRSSITQVANKVAIVIDGNNNIKAAQIVASINSGGSSVIISADHINLDGYVKATDITADFIAGKIAQISTLQGIAASFSGNITSGGAVMASGIYVGSGGGYTNISNGVRSVVLTGPVNNVYTLTSTLFDGSYQSYSFSRATTLSGAWSGGKFTVNARPQGESFWTQLVQGTPDWSGSSATSVTVTIPIKAYDKDNPNYSYNTGRSVTSSHSTGLTQYGNYTLYYKGSDDDYVSAGYHTWYYA